MKLAAEQAEINQKMEALQAEVDKQDQDIQRLQKKLKEAEQLLATAIYQARQKLLSIAKANRHPISSEELIKYAHRISASNAVCAPLNWQAGDPRRPYPTDMEMRMGLLGKLSDLPTNGHLASLAETLHRSGHQPEVSSSQHSMFSWHSGEIHVAMGNQGSVAMDTRSQSHKESEDVEVMSTDSSSSSSSDSQ